MQDILKKTCLKTLSAKVPAEVKSVFEKQAQEAGMSKSGYLRLVIEKSDISQNHIAKPIKAPKETAYQLPNNNLILENQRIQTVLQQIIINQNAILKENKLVSNLQIGIIGLMILGNLIILIKLGKAKS